MVQIASIVGTARREDLPDSGRARPAQASPLGMGANPGLSDLGAGVTRAGEALAQAAIAYKRDQDQLRQFNAETAFTNFGSEIQAGLEERSRSLSGDASGFTRDVMADYDRRAGEWLGSLPEDDRAKWQARLAQQRATVSRVALATEFRQRDAYYQTTISDQLDRLRAGIDQTPDALEQYRARGEEIIRASGLPEQKKNELIQGWRDNADIAYGAALARNNPDAVAGALGGDNRYNRITRSVESGGDDNVANRTPGSTSRGRYGFITSTWNALVNSPEGRAAGLTADGRGNPAQEEDAMRIYTAQSRRQLAAAGMPASEKNLYMLHFLGQTGGTSFLRRLQENGGANAAEAFPTEAQANRAVFFKDQGRGAARTLQEVYDLQTRRFGTNIVGAPGSDPVLERLPYQARQSLRERAEREIVQQDNEAARVNTALNNELWNRLQTDIIDGRAGRTEIDAARQAGWLVDAPRIAQAYAAVERRERDAYTLTAANAKLADPNALWNPFDQNDKNFAEALVMANGGSPQAAFDVWNRTGVLARSGATALRGALASTDVSRVTAALQIASNMMEPRANGRGGGNVFAGVDGREEIERAAVEFQRLLRGNIVDNAEQAAQRVMQWNDPQVRARVAARDKEFDDLRKTEFTVQKASGAVADLFDTWAPFDRPNIPNEQRAAIAQDYVDLVADNYRQTGDLDAAKNAAKQRLRAMYGVSNGNLMRYPPERTYPASDDPRDPHGYIYRQALEAAKEFRPGVEIDPRSVRLVPLPGMRTAEPWRNGQPAPYQIVFSYKDANGQTLFDATPPDGRTAFVADPAAERRRLSEERERQFNQRAPAVREQFDRAAGNAAQIGGGQRMMNEALRRREDARRGGAQ